LNFADAQFLCQPSQGRPATCSTSQNQCNAGVGLTPLLPCSGNGIPRLKDFSGEYYCACGSPVSALINITGVWQITQLVANGYGGPACTGTLFLSGSFRSLPIDIEYYADGTQPLTYSMWDYATNEPYRSSVTGVVLPGLWFKGTIIMVSHRLRNLLDEC